MSAFPTHLRDTSNHINDKAPEGAEYSNMLASSLPDSEGYPVDLPLHQLNVDIGMPEVLGQCTTGTLDGDDAGLDSDFDTLWNIELFSLEDIPHLG